MNNAENVKTHNQTHTQIYKQTNFPSGTSVSAKITVPKPPLFSKVSLLLTSVGIIFSIALFSLGLSMAVNNIDKEAARADKMMQKEKASAATNIDLSNALRTSTADRFIKENSIPAYTEAQVRSMDVSKPSGVTVSDLKLITKGNLKGLEAAFLKAEKDYGVNCLFVMAIASLESADGTICFRPNNMFGYGSSGFSSKAEGINVVSKALAQKYLRPGSSLYSGKTISSVNKRYAASSTWDDKVAARMTDYYKTISKNHNAALNKLK